MKQIIIPGLSNFYNAGHWVAPGGRLPGAALSARRTIKLLYGNKRAPFETQHAIKDALPHA